MRPGGVLRVRQNRFGAVCRYGSMNCFICPRDCGADRNGGERGFCGCDGRIFAARAALHFWEEPIISGTRGSGAVFFSGCSLRCVYCQNREISRGESGKEVTPERLYDIFFELKARGAHNINLVTPTHYTLQLIPVLERARQNGIGIPIVWNSGGYEKADTLRRLIGLVDVYLPDLKYISSETASRLSGAADYFEYASAALDEMVSQTGRPIINRGTIRRGTVVRHLVLPGHADESIEVIGYLYRRYGDSIILSIMSQYTPVNETPEYPELSRTVTEEEYGKVVEYAKSIGVTQAYVQSGGAAKESFIPQFDAEGI